MRKQSKDDSQDLNAILTKLIIFQPVIPNFAPTPTNHSFLNAADVKYKLRFPRVKHVIMIAHPCISHQLMCAPSPSYLTCRQRQRKAFYVQKSCPSSIDSRLIILIYSLFILCWEIYLNCGTFYIKISFIILQRQPCDQSFR